MARPVTRGELLTLSAKDLEERLGAMTDKQRKDLFSKTDIQTLIFVILVKLGGYKNRKAMEKLEDKLQFQHGLSSGLKDAAAEASRLQKLKKDFDWKNATVKVTISGKEYEITLTEAMAFAHDPSILKMPKGSEREQKIKNAIGEMKLDKNPDVAIQQINSKSDKLGTDIKKVAAEAQKMQSENTTFDEMASNLIKTFTNMTKDATRNIG